MKKKIASTVLCATMVAGMFAGCGSSDTKTTTAAKDDAKTTTAAAAEDKTTEADVKTNTTPVTISMFYCNGATEPFQKNWLVNELLKEYVNVTLDPQLIPSTDLDTKRQLLINSGELPDILAHTFPKSADCLAGVYLPISDYTDKMPNFKKFIEDNGLTDIWDNMVESNGKHYYFPVRSRTEVLDDHNWIIRKDILDKNNIEMPKTMDELVEVGKKLKQIYPDSIPISNRFQSANIMSGICWGYNTIAGWSLGNGMYFDYDKNEWSFAPVSDNWKDMVTVAKKLYETGALDKEYATRESEEMEQMITQSKIFGAYDWVTNCDRMNTEGRKNDKDFNMVPMNLTGYEGVYTAGAKGFCDQAWALPASLADDSAKLDRILEFIDWCYTDEAATVLTFGKEGTSYKKNDKGEKVWMDATENHCQKWGVYNNELTVRFDMDLYTANVSEALADYYKFSADNKVSKKPQPASPLSADKNEEIAVTATTLIDYCKGEMEKFINGTESLDNWDKFVKECEKKGYKTLEDAYKEAAK